MLYRSVIRPALFRCDAEWTHDTAIRLGHAAGRIPGLLSLSTRIHRWQDPRLQQTVLGIPFQNPIGLAAGYDKSGLAIGMMASLGFGHLEIGSISSDPSSGNPKPRLWRLPQDQAICVHYGLPNDGAVAVAERLHRVRPAVPLGINLVNTNLGPNASAASVDQILDDYLSSAKVLAPVASYLMLNLSCPNTRDGCSLFSSMAYLHDLLQRLEGVMGNTPTLLKIPPEQSQHSVAELLETADSFDFVKGLMLNLSPTRRDSLTTPQKTWSHWPGAISGKPVQEWMDRSVAKLYQSIDPKRHVIIAAGGVSTAEDAYRKIRCGASLTQLLTSLIYEGPGVVKSINRGLSHLLDRDGVGHLSEVIGVDAAAANRSAAF